MKIGIVKETDRIKAYEEYVNKICKEVETYGTLLLNEKVGISGVNTNIKSYSYKEEVYHIIMVNGVYIDFYTVY